ncbi:hypothetical protein [Parasphingorhabdus sp.]|uniref:hypothetical protein n=1 Tax=Parasphingorhabdus sp. TaxID=2709688 RepID=UPI003A92CF85
MVRTKALAKISVTFLLSCAVFAAAPISAKSKGWDVERYDQCLKRDGLGDLDLIENISSDACRKGRMAITQSDYPVGYFDVAASIAASREKRGDQEWAVFVKLRITTTDDRFYGPAAVLNQPQKEIPRFSTMSIMLGEELHEMEISSQKSAFPDCNSYYRRGLGMTKCDLVSGVVVHLNQEILQKIKDDAARQPFGDQKFKLFTHELKGLTLKIPYAEIISVAKSAQ